MKQVAQLGLRLPSVSISRTTRQSRDNKTWPGLNVRYRHQHDTFVSIATFWCTHKKIQYSCHQTCFWRWKSYKCVCGWGCAPGRTGRAYSAPPLPLAGYGEAVVGLGRRRGKWKEADSGGEGWGGRWGEGKGGKGREGKGKEQTYQYFEPCCQRRTHLRYVHAS